MHINFSNLPDPPKEYQVSLTALYGGLNTSRLPSEIGRSQLSDCLNVYWRDGMIRSRNGQERLVHEGETAWCLTENTTDTLPLAMYDKPWHDRLFMAFTENENEIGYIVCYSLKTKKYETLYTIVESNETLVDWSKGYRGSFFAFGDALYYKNRHLYLKIECSEDEATGTETVTASPVEPYVPIVQINTNAAGVGDLYQPENRLTPKKEIWFNGDSGIEYVECECDGTTKTFHLPYKKRTQEQDGDLRAVAQVYIGAALGVEGADYTVDLATGTVTTLAQDAPALGLKLTVKLTRQKFLYYLPSKADNVLQVFVKDLSSGAYVPYQRVTNAPSGQEYSYSSALGALCFDPTQNIAPDADANVLNSFIKVIYSLGNEDAFDAIDECYVAEVFGATGIETNCIVMAGASAQPNAIFWSGNDSNGANPAYFPVTNYNLAGSSDEQITALGRQQNRLVILQKSRVSSADYVYTTVDGRLNVSLNIRQINNAIGCDMPQSVQLINNNLVWAHSKHGVLYLKDSTYAYETLIARISGNINEASKVDGSAGLIDMLRENRLDVCSADDGMRYWLFVGSAAYVWDYTVQPYTADTQKLCWWKMDNICSAAWAVAEDGNMYGLSSSDLAEEDENSNCWALTFGVGYQDFGMPIERIIQMQTQVFGTYTLHKNVTKMILSVNGEAASHAAITYITDYEHRKDLTDINADVPTTRPTRYPALTSAAALFVRKPKCLHVHSFAVRLDTSSAHDMNLISCQICYNCGARVKAGPRR